MNFIKRIVLSYFTPVVLAAAFITGCTKDDGPIRKEYLDIIDELPVVAVAINGGSASIDVLNKGDFKGTFTTSLYFGDEGLRPDKVDIVISKNGARGTAVKVYKSDVTTFPITFTATVAEIEQITGAPVLLGDVIEFGADIYYKGKKYESFPVGGVGAGSGPLGYPDYSYTARYGAICAYDPDIYQGDFEVLVDEWEDFAPGDIITLTKVDNTTFSFIHEVAQNPLPIIVKVNTLNNGLTIERLRIGDKWLWPNSYTGAFVFTAGSAALNYVLPCDQEVVLNLQYGVDQGNFGGTYILRLRKRA